MQVRTADIDEWTRVGSDTFVPLRVTTESDSFNGSMTGLFLAGISVVDIHCTPACVERTPRQVAGDMHDEVLLNIQLSGTGFVTRGDTSVTLLPGSATVSEADRPYQLRLDEPANVLTIQVPRSRFGRRDQLVRRANGRVIPAESYGLVVLRHFLLGLLRAGDDVQADEQTFGTTAVSLLTTALEAHGPTGGSLPDPGSQLAAIRAFIDMHANKPELTVDDVALFHGISRRQLELLFATGGDSPSAYLRGLRLQRACGLLRRGTSALTVADVAFAVGFTDVTTFIRAFRRAYECTPGEWRRRSAPRRGPAPNDVRPNTGNMPA